MVIIDLYSDIVSKKLPDLKSTKIFSIFFWYFIVLESAIYSISRKKQILFGF